MLAAQVWGPGSLSPESMYRIPDITWVRYLKAHVVTLEVSADAFSETCEMATVVKTHRESQRLSSKKGGWKVPKLH